MSQGAVYIITKDQRYVDLLLISAASLKRAMPDLPITVFSQFPVDGTCFERVIPVEPSQDGFYDKAKLLRQTPYDRTLFLDADTYVVEAVPELFSMLDYFDCAATHEEYVNTDWFSRYPRPDIPACYPEFNTGVVAFKRSETIDRFLQHCDELYQSFLEEKPGPPIGDQIFFRVAAYFSDIRIATLPREYNCKFRGQGYLNGRVKIIHGHVKYQLTPKQVAEALGALNASTKPRVYIAGEVYEQELVGRLVSQRKAHKIGSFPELPGSIMLMRANRLKEVIKERGIRSTLAKVFAAK
jgi:hypothetical protein